MKILVNQLLCFPVIATLLVALSLVCGFSCAAWQWWLAVAVVYSVGLWKSDSRKCDWWKFPALLAGYWLLCHLIQGETSNDLITYHFPAIKMLILGWNPIWQGTPEAIYQTLGLEPGTMHALHVVAMPKSIWYYSACSYFFHGNVFNLMVPIVLPICFTVFGQVWHTTGKTHWVIKTVICTVIFFLLPSINVPVDVVVGVSAVGLVSALVHAVKKNEFRWLDLFVFSFWMATAKQTAALQCAIIWIVFSAAILVKCGFARFRPLAFLAGTLVAAFVLTSVSPYVTNLVNYGHPLYPKFTADPVKYPVVDIMCDFLDRNEDAASMGKVQAFLNSYVSHDLVRFYNQKILGKTNWRPQAFLWHFGGMNSEGYDSPTKTGYRACFVMLMALVLAFGGLVGNLTVLAALCSIFAMPTEMIGYLRYVPWIVPSFVLLTSLNFEKLNVRSVHCGLPLIVLIAYFVPAFVHLVFLGAIGIDHALATRLWLKSKCSKQIVVGNSYTHENPTVSGKDYESNCILTQRLCSDLSWRELRFDGSYGRNPNSMTFYDRSFFVPDGEGLASYSDHYRNCNLSNRRERLSCYPMFIIKAYTVDVARIIISLLNV